MNTMNAMIFTTAAPLRWELEAFLAETKNVRTVGNFHAGYPTYKEMEILFRVHTPSVLFVDLADLSQALELVTEARQRIRGVQIIAFGKSPDSTTILAAMRAGVQEVVNVPLRSPEVTAAIAKATRELTGAPIAIETASKVYSFLPAKPGVGASTTCLNVASEMSKLSASRVLLMDLDLDCGSIDFLLNLDAGFSARDAAEYGEHMDETIWTRLMTKVGKLDVLRAGQPQPDRPVSPASVTPLINFARPRYEAVLIDLPSVGSPLSMEVASHSNRIYLVTSPEVCALHLALRSLDVLKSFGLKDRVHIIVNREDSRSEMRVSQIEDLLDVKVAAAIPNDWGSIQRHMAAGNALIPNGALAARYAQIAKSMVTNEPIAEKGNKGLLGGLRRMWSNV